MRTIDVIYGPNDCTFPMKEHGGDVYVETAPGIWSRIVDIPAGSPAEIAISQGNFKSGIDLADGTTLTQFNARSAAHRDILRAAGLTINIPSEPDPVEPQNDSEYLLKQKLTLMQRLKKVFDDLAWLKVTDKQTADMWSTEQVNLGILGVKKVKEVFNKRMKELGMEPDTIFLDANVKTTDPSDPDKFYPASLATKMDRLIGLTFSPTWNNTFENSGAFNSLQKRARRTS